MGAESEHNGELQVRQADLLHGGHGQGVQQVVDNKHHLYRESQETEGVEQHVSSGEEASHWTVCSEGESGITLPSMGQCLLLHVLFDLAILLI